MFRVYNKKNCCHIKDCIYDKFVAHKRKCIRKLNVNVGTGKLPRRYSRFSIGILLVCTCPCLLSCLLYLITYFLAFLLFYILLACLFAYLLGYLFACLFVYLFAYSPRGCLFLCFLTYLLATFLAYFLTYTWCLLLTWLLSYNFFLASLLTCLLVVCLPTPCGTSN